MMKLFGPLLSGLILLSCSDVPGNLKGTGTPARIYPDYAGITIPPNIAPLNFRIEEDADRFIVVISSDGESIKTNSRNGKIIIPGKKWKRMLESARGGELVMELYARKSGDWFKFPPVKNKVAEEPIDNYIVYRLIDPGFELWNKMGIYQRSLESFSEEPVMINSVSGENCINCHSFRQNDSRTMMFHMRSKYGGTVIYKDGILRKINTKTDSTLSAGVYPSWHPGGRYIAFSVNNIVQTFHSVNRLKAEVTDTLSDLIIYDTELNAVMPVPSASDRDSFETYPSWSPDGKYLYFCSAVKQPLSRFNSIRYDLLRIPFDASSCRFGVPDTVIRASRQEKSVSFPRVSPDGRYLMYSLSAFGNFPVWHRESDIYMKDLRTGEVTKPGINSDNTESYHSWSSDGRWIIFSSRRDDGLFTRLYISYFDLNGTAHKPFILPQRDPDYYDGFLKSYNLPEPVKSKVDLDPRKLQKTVVSEPVNAGWR